MNVHVFSKKEEVAHAITHAIGAVLSVIGLILLIIYSSLNGTGWHIVSATIFGVTMLLMYISSTVVHSLPKGKWKDLFQIIDHASIYLFIAGTYTPFLLVHLREGVGWFLFFIIWGIALIGVVFKVFFINRFLILSTLIYVVMGWLIITVWSPLTETVNEKGILLLIIGGIFYTVGAVFYMIRKIPYHHVIWHLFVLAGSICHFFSVFYYVI
ncbi:PAQR family membrane homeostasis protein TrhA [Virgibacillus sp. W0430]|uniref:PAQR family membrane homeostasis protein TrhA n=1 Tax=Virgibacillus sp. W0430 TaxID=3391580 RepID=UPI003F484477